MDSLKSRGFRRAVLLHLAAFLIAVSVSAIGQSESDPWLILADGKSGLINVRTTRQDLVRIYGASNVVEQDVDLGEGETQTGTVLFAKDPQRRIEILWKDPEKKSLPASVQIEGTISRWKAVHNITLGTSLKDLERWNGRPFQLSGFGWDYSGTITSWQNGSLTADFDSGRGKVFIRLDYSPSPGPSVPEGELDQVQGDRDFSSNHSVMQKINPRAYQIIWVFPSPTQP